MIFLHDSQRLHNSQSFLCEDLLLWPKKNQQTVYSNSIKNVGALENVATAYYPHSLTDAEIIPPEFENTAGGAKRRRWV